MADRGQRWVVKDTKSVLKSYNIEARIDVNNSKVSLGGVQFDDAKRLAGRVLRLEYNIDVKTSFV